MTIEDRQASPAVFDSESQGRPFYDFVRSNQREIYYQKQISPVEWAHLKVPRVSARREDELHITKAAGTNMTLFNAAVADYFREPAVLEIDASEWQGRAGNEIWVQAVDDTLVTKVHVTISNQNGAGLEEGNAQRAAGLWWTYTAHTQVPMEPKPHVVVTAYDQPGHSAELVWEN